MGSNPIDLIIALLHYARYCYDIRRLFSSFQSITSPDISPVQLGLHYRHQYMFVCQEYGEYLQIPKE